MGCNDRALEVAARSDGGKSSISLPPEQAARVLARVGEHTITLGDYVAALEHMDQFDRMRYQSPERRKELLNEMIDLELLANEARQKGYDQDPLAQQEIRGILRDSMLQQARKGAATPADLPDAEVHAYYDTHRDEFRDPERRRISAVVLRDPATANQVLDAAKKAADASKFGELVRAKSTDPQAKANVPVDLAGDLGMVSPPGDARGENSRVPEAVRTAAFQIPNAGDVAPQAVAADGKFYVVRLTQKLAGHDRTYAEAERSIRVKLVQDKLAARDLEILTTLRAEYPVTINEAALSTVHVDTGDAGAAGGGADLPAAMLDAGVPDAHHGRAPNRRR